MSKLTLSQWRGVKDLVQDAVDAGVQATATAHLRIAQKPFAILSRIDAIAAPVRAVDGIHALITRSVYGSIRLINRVAGASATEVLDRLARKADAQASGREIPPKRQRRCGGDN